MTTEEKARAYDEALEVMRQWIAPCHTKEQLDTLKKSVFPELAESEDERHRKWILECLYDGLRKADDQFKEQFKSAIAWLEKQKEQKPAEWEDYKDKVNIPYCSSEPEWSEENYDKISKQVYKAIRRALASLAVYAEDEALLDSKEETLSYYSQQCAEKILKSLRPPLKDREMKLKILKYLSTRCSSLEFEEVEDYLNNLRPSWKPSEEQISALNYFIKLWGNSDDQLEYTQIFINVKSLYEQLKKL